MTAIKDPNAKLSLWREGDSEKPVPIRPNKDIFRPEILDAIEKKMEEMSDELRELSLDIHSHPELKFQETHAHDVMTAFMSKHGFEVEKHCLLDTAWRATFKHGSGGRIIGVNSEMDALPGVGHGMAGIAVACAMKAAMGQFNISGTIQLLGTPGEEGGGGKVKLLEKGAYKDMDICLMCHPAPGPKGSVSISSCLALQRIAVEYFGHTAHAALSPWEGINALDAAVLAYNNVSALRQQLKPTVRVHGIFEGKDWATNIIPDYAKYLCYVRAPTRKEQEAAMERVMPCFEAAALATGCEHKITIFGQTHDLRQNKTLGDEVAYVFESRYGRSDTEYGISSASTDFGNVTYGKYLANSVQKLPSLHPGFAIPTVQNGGNHTSAFTKAAATLEAHNATLDVSKALAHAGIRTLLDDHFFSEIKRTFEEDKVAREMIA
ncbi:hypothetical protein D9758_009404 [Tetrapyrgos nigripes]|uniref:Peptidase M20 domain-containing protein 2 n=1 Tax=Tetrapyrgos nigripes TaxID=182062 RepID=A0A8H5D233_9AGAR|nr:hypothetical protein D9758_009404 [Tetrapyrgos nigripes]